MYIRKKNIEKKQTTGKNNF